VPDRDAKIPEGRLVRLLLARFPGQLLWRLKTEVTVRKGARTAVTRPVDNGRGRHGGSPRNMGMGSYWSQENLLLSCRLGVAVTG